MKFDQKANTDDQDGDRNQEMNVRDNCPGDFQKAHLSLHIPPEQWQVNLWIDTQHVK